MTDETSDDAIPGSQERAGGEDTRVRQRAYEIWLEEGRPHDRALEHWLQAKREFAQGNEDVRFAEGEIASLSESD